MKNQNGCFVDDPPVVCHSSFFTISPVISIFNKAKIPMIIVSRQYTRKTSFALQFKNQTPITGIRFATISDQSPCVSLFLLMSFQVVGISNGKITNFGTSPLDLLSRRRGEVRH